MSSWALTVYGRVESVNELLGLELSTEELNLSMSCWALTVYGRVESVNEPLGLDRLRKS